MCRAHIPGSSFGRKKCRTSIGQNIPPDSPKKRRGPEKTSGSKILNNRDEGWNIHKQTAFAPQLVLLEHICFIPQPHTGAFRSHCPRPSSECPKSRTITKYEPTCAQAKISKKKLRSIWQGTLLSLQPCL